MANLVWKQQYSAPGDEVLPLRAGHRLTDPKLSPTWGEGRVGARSSVQPHVVDQELERGCTAVRPEETEVDETRVREIFGLNAPALLL